MLKALKAQLTRLAEEDYESFARKVWVCSNGEDDGALAASLRNFILVTPEMIAQVRAWADDRSVPAEVKRLHGFLLSYLYHPADFLPDEPYGLFGYLDDAYLVGRVYQLTYRHLAAGGQRPAAGAAGVGPQADAWVEETRRVLPDITGRIDIMLEQLSAGEQTLFEHALGAARNK